MASIADALQGAPSSQMADDLGAGLSALSLNQAVNFFEYSRTVLPLDGYVFWVSASPKPKSIKGSLHYATARRQDEDATQAVNQITFSTRNPVTEFNCLAPGSILIAEHDGIRFSFSARAPFFQAAGLFHYSGTAVLPTMASQVLDNEPDASQAIVSNSLPIWLSLNSYEPPYPGFVIPDGLTLYPSFVVPENLRPPYGAVHIAPEGTEALAGAPHLGRTLSSYQLVKDRVRITLYGCNNDTAISLLNFILQYSADNNTIGLLNVPTVRDGKKPQPEIAALAQQKFIDFDVSYHQTTARNVARQMIEKVVVNYQPQPYG